MFSDSLFEFVTEIQSPGSVSIQDRVQACHKEMCLEVGATVYCVLTVAGRGATNLSSRLLIMEAIKPSFTPHPQTQLIPHSSFYLSSLKPAGGLSNDRMKRERPKQTSQPKLLELKCHLQTFHVQKSKGHSCSVSFMSRAKWTNIQFVTCRNDLFFIQTLFSTLLL